MFRISSSYILGFALVLFFIPRVVLAGASPSISSQPQNATNLLGSDAVFNVVAGGQTPLFYQWSFKGTDLTNSTHIGGATNATLVVSNVAAGDVGNYQVTVTNSHGSITSSNAMLTVLFPASITSPPTGQSVVLSNTATFTASAAGTAPLSYRWYFNGAALVDGGRITGSGTTNLNIANVQAGDGGFYQLVVTNNYGAATSTVVTLTVFIPATIAVQPTNQAVVQSNNVSFAVTAAGTAPLSFQWYFNGTLLTDGGRITGSGTTNLNIANVQAGDVGPYQLVVTNNYGVATSTVAMLAVFIPATIGVQPTDQAVVQSNNVSFAATAAGTAPLSFQWYFNGTPLTDGGRITGSGTTNLNITNVQAGDAGPYLLVVTNNYGVATSAVANLTVLIPATISGQPTNQTVVAPNTATFAASAAGTAPLIFQWYFNGTPLTDGGRITGSGTTNLTIANVQTNDTGPYQLVVTNNYGMATSAVAMLTVLLPPAIVQQPANETAQWGASATFSVVASGTAPLNYQWSLNGAGLTGATGPVLLLTNLQPSQAGNYACTVTNGVGSVVSSNAVLTVGLPPAGVPYIAGFSPLQGYPGTAVTITGTNFSVVVSNNTVYFGAVQAAVVSASVTNLVVTVPAGATFSPITETVGGLTAYANTQFLPTFFSAGTFTSASLGPQLVLHSGSGPNKVVIADLDGDGKPDLIVCDDYGNSISIYRNISTNGVLSTNSFAPPVTLATPSGTYDPFGLVVADVDGDGKLDIIVSDYSLALVSVYRNTCTPGNISSSSFATRVDFATGNSPQGVEVRDLDGDGKPDLLVANSGDGTISILRNTSVPGSLTTNSFAPRVDLPTGLGCDHVVVADLDGDGLPDIVTANDNGAGTVSILRNLGTPGSLTTNSFAPVVNLPVLSDPVQVTVGDVDGDGKPDLVVTFYLPYTTVSVLQNISTPGSLTANSFAPRVDFALNGRGHTPVLADLDGDGLPDLAVVTELNSQLSIFRNVSTPGSFTTSSLGPRLDFATGYNAWGAAIGDLDGDGRPDIAFANSYDNTISIYQNEVPRGGVPIIGASPQNQTVLAGGTAVLTVVVSDGSQPLTYQWQYNGVNLPDATNNPLVLNNALVSQSGPYSVVVSNSYGQAFSSNANLTVLPLQIVGQPQTQSALAGTVVNLSVGVNGQQPLYYQWQYNGTNLPDATNNPLVLSNVLVSQTGVYSVVVTNTYGMAVSSNAVLTVTALNILNQPQNQSAVVGGTVNFTLSVSGQTPWYYQWLYNGTNLPGATNYPLTLTNVQLSQSGIYSVVITNAYGMIVSSNATLTVLPLLITAQPTNQVTWPGGSARFKVSVSGQPPFNFEWQYNGVDVPGTWTNALTLTNVQQFGAYSVIVSNVYGSVVSSNAFLLPSQVAVWGGNSGETNLPAGLTNVIAIAGGGYARLDCLALRSNGTAIHWPSTIINGAKTTNFLAIAGGGPQAVPFVVLQTNGVVAEWLVDDIIEPLTGLTNAVAIAADIYFPLALKTNGTLLGGYSPAGPGPPAALANTTNAVAISEGSGFSMALKADGTVIAWGGSNTSAQTNVPPGLNHVMAIAAGYFHALALKSDGTVVAWGVNTYGQTNVPPGLSNVVAIAAGQYHSLALQANGTVTAWGNGANGQTNVPPGLSNVVAIAAGASHSMALIGNGPPVTSALLSGPSAGVKGFNFSVPSQSGRAYVLQYKNSFTASNWNSLPLVPGNGGTLLLTDPFPTNSQRFYRVQRW